MSDVDSSSVADDVAGQGGRPRGSTREAVNSLGFRIVSRDPYKPSDVLSLNTVMDEVGGSRALAREVLQVLHQKGLVALQPRVGATVQPLDRWDVFDPDVIAWRLQVAPRFQMRSLTELREAIEPWAARLAAQRASADVCRDLVSLSRQLRTLGEDELFKDVGDAGAKHRERYRAVDAAFHEALLRGSQNEMFFALSDAVKEALDYRIVQDWEGAPARRGAGPAVGGQTPFPQRPEAAALWFHHGLAYAVDQGQPKVAEAFSRAILAEIQNGRLTDPITHAGTDDPGLREALERGLDQLDPRGMRKGDWEPFHATVMAVVKGEK